MATFKHYLNGQTNETEQTGMSTQGEQCSCEDRTIMNWNKWMNTLNGKVQQRKHTQYNLLCRKQMEENIHISVDVMNSSIH